MKANKMIGKYFETIPLTTEIILIPYDSESDIDVLLDAAPISDGGYVVFFHKEDKIIKKLSKFVDFDFDIFESYFILLLSVTETNKIRSVLVINKGKCQCPIEEKHSRTEWVLYIIAKLKGVLIYEKNFNVSKQWRKVFP